jgi:predicted Rossmann fold nucleotide-binding protein DprA/Smf involved in DNA uptake
MAQGKGDFFSGDDFLAEYARLTKNASQQPQPQSSPAPASLDAGKRVMEVLANGPTTFTKLQEQSGADFFQLGDAIARLQKLGAVRVSGSGPGQSIELTDHGREIAQLLTSAS